MKIYELLQDRKSQVLIIAIIFIAIVLVLGTGLLFHARSSKGITDLQTKTNKAYSLAKSGLELAASQIGAGSGGSSGSCSGGGGGSGNITETTYTLGSGQITIKATDGAITSTGKFADSWQVLTKTVPVPQGGTPVTTWAKSFGASGNDKAKFARQTSDGGYILYGYTNPPLGAGNMDILVVKLDANGNLDTSFGIDGSTKYGAITFGGTKDEWVSKDAFAVCAPSVGGYILGSIGKSFGTTGHIMLVKINNDGNIAWKHVYGSNGSDEIVGIAVSYNTSGSPDGYVLLTKYAGGDILLWKVDLDGNRDLTFGGGDGIAPYHAPYSMAPYSIQQTVDGVGIPNGYIIGGFIASGGTWGWDFVVIKTDPQGNALWSKSYGTDNIQELIWQLQQTSDGGYILGGYRIVTASNTYDWQVIKIFSNGNVDWAKIYDENSYNDTLQYIQQTSDDGYIIGGYDVISSQPEMLVIKTNSSGDLDTTFGTNGGKVYGNVLTYDLVDSIAQTNDRGYIIMGITDGWTAGALDFMAIKTDAFGEICCSTGNNISRAPTAISVTPITVAPANITITVPVPILKTDNSTPTISTSNPNLTKTDICN